MRYQSFRTRARKPALTRVAAPLALVAAAVLSSTSGQHAAVPSATPALFSAATDNPLVGHPWGTYKGKQDMAWQPYVNASGTRKKLLAKIALRPKAKWFGAWIGNDAIGGKVRDYIANATGGDPNVLVQMTIFRVKPWEHDACKRLPTSAEVASYKQWIDRFAGAVGTTYAAVVVQPDGPFALCAPGGSTAASDLVRYAVNALGAKPHTAVYIDAGASDWLRDDPARAARILVPAGVANARGFAFNSTHYVSTGRDVRFGAAVAAELASRGIPGKHFVVNTSSNGRPFPGYSYDGPNFDNARVCTSPADTRCVTLGIPPTTDVASATWGMRAVARAKAAQYCDAYLWIGRPWLYNQASPFDLNRALAEARTTPF